MKILSKEDLKLQMNELASKGIKFSIEDNFNGSMISMTLKSDNETFGGIVAHNFKDFYIIMEVESWVKGYGKFLYYNLMDYVYPKYLKAGYVVSTKALRVWDCFPYICESRDDLEGNKSYGKTYSKEGELQWKLIDKQFRLKF